jgi:ubiquinone/menaquinone biosynthesis C-methylase UbiE
MSILRNGILEKKNQNFKLLDLGCGNGWLANLIATAFNGGYVLGIDINKYELTQANNVFNLPNIKFAYMDIFDDCLHENIFDYILLSCSVQYFPDIKLLVNKLLSLLKIDGEIHIIDTPFYTNEEILSAKFRSEKYFNKYNSAMKDKYFHHQLNNLSEFKTKIIFNPKSPINRIKRSLFDDITPFLHIAIMR